MFKNHQKKRMRFRRIGAFISGHQVDRRDWGLSNWVTGAGVGWSTWASPTLSFFRRKGWGWSEGVQEAEEGVALWRMG